MIVDKLAPDEKTAQTQASSHAGKVVYGKKWKLGLGTSPNPGVRLGMRQKVRQLSAQTSIRTWHKQVRSNLKLRLHFKAAAIIAKVIPRAIQLF
ncbi:hypothetical protein V8J88_17825 [Massilia sp. W12]|uniref:hypothetical protein n=1 Tax=Massilia sp. W12 TaxID=3126507 RepID=UPI0030D0F85E